MKNYKGDIIRCRGGQGSLVQIVSEPKRFKIDGKPCVMYTAEDVISGKQMELSLKSIIAGQCSMAL